MTSFNGFGEAAKLYAQYKPVVDEMQKAFATDIESFLDALHEEIEAVLPGYQLAQEVTKKWRNWWIKLPMEKATDVVPYVYTELLDTTVVSDGQLWIGLWWDHKDANVKTRLNAVAGAIDLPPHCHADRSRKPFFAMTIDLGVDPVASAVEPLRSLLVALHGVRLGAID